MSDELEYPPQVPSTEFPKHPSGGFPLQCVDLIPLGEEVNQKFGKVEPKIALIFRSGELREDGKHFELSKVVTFSHGEKAHLRKFLEGWRGRAFGEAEPPPHLAKLVGVWGYATVGHEERNGKTYVNILAMAPLPKGLPLPTLDQPYVRAEYWEKRKAEMAERVRLFRAAQPQPTGRSEPSHPKREPAGLQQAKAIFDAVEVPNDEDDGLPF